MILVSGMRGHDDQDDDLIFESTYPGQKINGVRIDGPLISLPLHEPRIM